MDIRFVCPDCGDEHDQPAEAQLGVRVRCMDCQLEVDLARELEAIPIRPLAA
jgi:predicted RNA-binding Zn-ribbon protein involved in translation (DUF1610 family)